MQAFIRNNTHWMILTTLAVVLLNLFFRTFNQPTAIPIINDSANFVREFEKSEACTSSEEKTSKPRCKIFDAEYKTIKVSTSFTVKNGKTLNITEIEAEKKTNSVDCVKYKIVNGEEREKHKHFPNRDTCPNGWDEE